MDSSRPSRSQANKAKRKSRDNSPPFQDSVGRNSKQSQDSIRDYKRSLLDGSKQEDSDLEGKILLGGQPQKRAHEDPAERLMENVVKRSLELQDMMKDDAVGLRSCTSLDTDIQLKFELYSTAEDLPLSDLEVCLSLVEETSGDDYRASSSGWDTSRKREEMLDKDMIYLVVRQQSVEELSTAEETGARQLLEAAYEISQVQSCGSNESANEIASPALPRDAPDVNSTILGFISFMFTFDEPPYQDREVVYIYEVHLETRLRGFGLGSKFIKFAENAALHCGVLKTMLTVFTTNNKARLLYEKLGYSKDECSPNDRVMRRKTVRAEYQIMSKNLPQDGL